MPAVDRRAFLASAARLSGGAGLATFLPDWARAISPGLVTAGGGVLTGEDITLTVDQGHFMVDGRHGHAIALNGTLPGPLIRLREGQRARITIDNRLDEPTSIHWHGLLVPFEQDGVPGVSFPGVPARGRFTYDFPLIQAGTYWYHSHSGMQEPMGQYGPLVIDPAGPDPIASDREHVLVLSDWSPVHPHVIMTKLKQQGGYFNWQKQTLASLIAGRDQRLKDRLEWGRMRMDPTDISDVTGSTYSFLVNGHGTGGNWTGLFRPGERLRLRIVNAAAMTIFNVRMPGLKMTVVAADGLPVRPVVVDEFQIANAETYDVIVEPAEDRAYAFIAEAVDRSGLVRATLAPRARMVAPVPALRARPLATMRDMGMDMAAMEGMEMDMSMRNPANAPGVAMTPGVQTIAPMPADRTAEPGQGLREAGHRTLVYADLAALDRNPDVRVPSREMEIHLTGNMERYMWAFDGKAFSPLLAPIPFRQGERVRVTLVNDTMMAHPIHLHGHFFELVTGHGDHAPRKHTVNVAPGGVVVCDLTADAPGDWAFHCHMMMHMHAGMFQVVAVRPEGAAA
ncbi:copper resistance system multicopper oxidase [Sphingomonas naphthae]|uniref:Copper resistance system multicopper oxidase n=1 Tax=Sphingomonas naphthae TaxID=1813468 RepID=A0ABY7TMY6_9SPHN|nr:copper resistance system multicopper oxidase [Sphingomonas naphthae]WCT74363.1 copper resistance system multicopper oxidase [Sphingomonas naphthae]